MKNANQNRKPYLLGSLLVIILAFCAWQLPGTKQKDTTRNSYSETGDTSRPGLSKNDKDEFGMKDFDECLKQLDLELAKLDENLKNIDINIDTQIEAALSKVDFEKINRDIEASVKKVDWDKIKIDVDNSLKEGEEQMKNIDLKKIEMQEQFNSKEFKEQLNSEKLHKQIEGAMKNARESIDKVKRELQQYKEFTGLLEKDGLIDKKKGYKIEWKDDGDLYLNGNKQTKEVSDKYRKYYKQGGYILKMDGEATQSL